MKALAAVVDTNVVAAALITSRPDSPVARLLDGMVAARFPFTVSGPLLAEYRTVLARPKLRKLHGLDDEAIEPLLLEIVRHAILVEPVRGSPAPDPGDQMLWNLLATRLDLLLVTGDRALLEDEAMNGRIVTPAQFFAGRTASPP